MCVGVSVLLEWSGIRVAGWSCAQHASDINISIIRSLRLFCWITTLVVLFLVRCVLQFWCGWVGVVSVLQAEACCNTDTTPTQPHRNFNTQWTKKNTTNVVIQQNSRKLLMIDILMSETFWAHKKWNKIASDIKLVFYSSALIWSGMVSNPGVYSQNPATDRLTHVEASRLKHICVIFDYSDFFSYRKHPACSLQRRIT